MELGRHLVRELDLDDGVDTLGRWMAHHLAELMDQAETAETADERASARERAAETILNIWDRRASLPGSVYPLASYKDILMIMERLRPNDNPFQYLGRDREAKRYWLAADLFDGLTRLIIALLLPKVPSISQKSDEDDIAIEALSESERAILRGLDQWGSLFRSEDANSEPSREAEKGTEMTNEEIDRAAVRLIDGLTSALAELGKLLRGTEQQNKNECVEEPDAEA